MNLHERNGVSKDHLKLKRSLSAAVAEQLYRREQ